MNSINSLLTFYILGTAKFNNFIYLITNNYKELRPLKGILYLKKFITEIL